MSNAVFDFDVSTSNILKLYDLYQKYNYKKKHKKFDATDIMTKKIQETHEKMNFIELKSNYVRVLCLWVLKTDINRSDIKKAGIDVKKIADFFDIINQRLQEGPEKAFAIIKQLYALYLQSFYENRDFRTFIAGLNSIVSTTSEKRFTNILLISFFEKPNIFISILDAIRLFRESFEKKSVEQDKSEVEENRTGQEENTDQITISASSRPVFLQENGTEKVAIQADLPVPIITPAQETHDTSNETKLFPMSFNESQAKTPEQNILITTANINLPDLRSSPEVRNNEVQVLKPGTGTYTELHMIQKETEPVSNSNIATSFQPWNGNHQELRAIFQEMILPLKDEIKIIKEELEFIKKELLAIKELESITTENNRPISLELTTDHLKTILDYFTQLSRK